MFDEVIKPPATYVNSLTPTLNYGGKWIREKFDEACLKQDKITFNHGETVTVCIVYALILILL